MKLLDSNQIRDLNETLGGMSWRQVIDAAVQLLDKDERAALGLVDGLEHSWFEEKRSTLDSWKARLEIHPIRSEYGHPRYHPLVINLVAVILRYRQIDRMSFSQIKKDLIYKGIRESLSRAINSTSVRNTNEWFRVLDDLEESFQILKLEYPDLPFSIAAKRLSAELVLRWCPEKSGDYSDGVFDRIAWLGLCEIVEEIDDLNLSTWHNRMTQNGRPVPFHILSSAYFKIATTRLTDLSSDSRRLMMVMFPRAVGVLQHGFVDLDAADTLILNWTLGLNREITGAFSLVHSERAKTPEFYTKDNDTSSPLTHVIDATMRNLFPQKALTINSDSVRCKLVSLSEDHEITVRTQIQRDNVLLELGHSSDAFVDIWQLSGSQRLRWEPRTAIHADFTSDWFIDSIGHISTERSSVRLRMAYNGLQFVAVPEGIYTIGDRLGIGKEDERPVHRVSLSEYSISSMPVTVGMYRRFMQDNPEWQENGEKARLCGIAGVSQLRSNQYLQTIQQIRDLISDLIREFDAYEYDAIHFQRLWVLAQLDDVPVIDIPWNAAVEFCNWFSLVLGIEAAYEQTPEGFWSRVVDSVGFRLPTETEWEVAASCGGHYLYGLADEFDPSSYTWLNNQGESIEVRIRKALEELHGKPLERDKDIKRDNPRIAVPSPWWEHGPSSFGIYQAIGNVWEWTDDEYSGRVYHQRTERLEKDPNYQLSTSERGDQKHGLRERVVRGGSVITKNSLTLRTTERHKVPENHCHYIGFRIARTCSPSS